MPLPNINNKVFNDIFKKAHKLAFVTLRSGKTKNAKYDPYRETGFDQTYQNPIPVKILTKTVSASSLTYNQIGLVKAGALQIILNNDDVELIKNAEEITIDDVSYYVYDEAVGNKLQIYDTQFADYSKIIVFRKDKGNV